MSSNELDPARAYDLWAATYDTDPNPMIALSGMVLQALEPVPASILEFGCGTGRNLAALAKRGASVLAGVDLSGGMLKIASERLPSASLWCQDALAPVEADAASFDLVLVSLVLEHIKDPSGVFAEAARLLTPTGKLLVLELHPQAFRAGSRARASKMKTASNFIRRPIRIPWKNLRPVRGLRGSQRGRLRTWCPAPSC